MTPNLSDTLPDDLAHFIYLGAFPHHRLDMCDRPGCVADAVAIAAYIEGGMIGTYQLCDPCVVLADRFLRDPEPTVPPVDEATLRRMYATGLSVQMIACRLKRGRLTVRNWFDFYGIQRRSPAEGQRLAHRIIKDGTNP